MVAWHSGEWIDDEEFFLDAKSTHDEHLLSRGDFRSYRCDREIGWASNRLKSTFVGSEIRRFASQKMSLGGTRTTIGKLGMFD